MSSYADRLTLDGVQHGTVAGYDAGCHAELSCPGRHAVGLSCLRARIRYAGDWPFRRLVDAGTPEPVAAQLVDADDAHTRRAARPDRPRARASRRRAGLVTPAAGASLTRPVRGRQIGAQQ